MSDDAQRPKAPTREPSAEMQRDFDELRKAGKKGILGRFSQRFDEALESGRGAEQQRNAAKEAAARPNTGADDLALRRARNVNTAKMIIPEGVIIEGHLTGGSDTEISGKIDGNVTVEGRLHLGASALISGDVRAGSLSVEGLVEGKVECSEDLDLGKSGRLNGDVVAGRKINISGQVFGSIMTPGALRLAPTARLEGDIRARALVMEEGATLNGTCSMRAPAQRTTEETK